MPLVLNHWTMASHFLGLQLAADPLNLPPCLPVPMPAVSTTGPWPLFLGLLLAADPLTSFSPSKTLSPFSLLQSLQLPIVPQ